MMIALYLYVGCAVGMCLVIAFDALRYGFPILDEREIPAMRANAKPDLTNVVRFHRRCHKHSDASGVRKNGKVVRD